MPNYLKTWQTEKLAVDNRNVYLVEHRLTFETVEELAAHATKENEQIFIIAAIAPSVVRLLLATAKQPTEQSPRQNSLLEEQESDLGLC